MRPRNRRDPRTSGGEPLSPEHKPARLAPPDCVWDADGLLRTRRFDDVYYSRAGGAAEKRHVFVAGCALPERFRKASRCTVAELGFGTGLNFMVTWDAWRRNRAPGAQLHYIAVEGYPLSPAALHEAARRWPELGALGDALARAYPQPQRGFCRVRLGGDDPPVLLTLLFGEASAMLQALEADVDAWFLDGFAPDRNPEMWSPTVMAEIARLSHGGADPTVLATYTVAGVVRRGLEAVGFTTAQGPGFGTKRNCLRATFTGTTPAPALQPWFARPTPFPASRHAAIIGAGLAGASAADALLARGWTVTLIDRHATPAQEASGNPVGVFMPRLAGGDGIEPRFHAAAWRYARDRVARLGEAGHATGWEECGVLQLASDAAEGARLSAIAEHGIFPEGHVQDIDRTEAARRAGCALPQSGVFLPQAGTIAPPLLCRALSTGAQFLSAAIDAVVQDATGYALHCGARVVCRADVVVFANAMSAAAPHGPAPWLPLTARRGQITFAPATPASRALRVVLAGDGYVTPARPDRHCLGATFDWVDDPDAPQGVAGEDHVRNVQMSAALGGDAFRELNPATCEGRAALRCMTPDHLPVSGPLPDAAAFRTDFAPLRHGQHWVPLSPVRYQPGLFALTGLGARGLVTAPLAAEILACHITGEPWPVERDLVTAVMPGRFLLRALKRLQS